MHFNDFVEGFSTQVSLDKRLTSCLKKKFHSAVFDVPISVLMAVRVFGMRRSFFLSVGTIGEFSSKKTTLTLTMDEASAFETSLILWQPARILIPEYTNPTVAILLQQLSN